MPYTPDKPIATPDSRQERETKPESPKKKVKQEGAAPIETNRLRAEDERSRILKINELQKRLGIKHLKDPEAMLLAVADRNETTVEQLNDTQRFLEASQIQLQQELLQTTDPKNKAALQEKIEANSRLIFKIEDARHAIENAGVSNKPEKASRILEKILSRDMDLAKGAEKAIRGMEQEQQELEAELENLYKEIEDRESGAKKEPSLMRRLSLGFGNLMRRISNQAEQARTPADMSLRELQIRRREIQQRLNQLEMNLINLRPPKMESGATWTPPPVAEEPEIPVTFEEETEETEKEPEIPVAFAEEEEKEEPVTQHKRRVPRPMTAAEKAANQKLVKEEESRAIKLLDNELKKLEARQASIDEELAVIGPQLEQALKKVARQTNRENATAVRELKRRRDALQKERDEIANQASRLLNQYPTKPTLPEILTEADIIPEEAEEASGVRRKPPATPPPLPEAAKISPAERARLEKEAEEAARSKEQTEAEAKEKAEFQKKVSWAEKLLPGGQAAAINEDVLGQMGVDWSSANEQQRNSSVEYVFKAAAVQEALKSGDDKAYDRAKAELQSFEKTLGLVRSPFFQPAGRAGVEVQLETGRAEQKRMAGRIAGAGTETTRGRARARRTVNEAPPMEAMTTETADLLDKLAELGKKQAAEREEKIMAGAKAAEETLAKFEESVRKNKEAIQEAAEIGKRMMNPMTIERTAEAVPKAKELWDLVAQTLGKQDKELEAKGAKTRKSISIMDVAKEPGAPDAATAYVMAMGRYLEAVNEPAPDYVIRAFGARVDKLNKLLGLENNALVQSIMAERGKKFGKPVGRNITRGKETTAQQARRAARVE
jgi:hypothetical protein